jgi:hypothetical protein
MLPTTDVVGPGGIGPGTRIGPSSFRLIGTGTGTPLDRRYSIRYRYKVLAHKFGIFLRKIQKFLNFYEENKRKC